MLARLAKQWNELPGYAHGVVLGVACGLLIGRIANTVATGVAVGLLLAAFAFCRPILGRHIRFWAGVAVVPAVLALVYLTANVLDPPNTLDPSVRSYNCGSVLSHPFTNPTSQWLDDQSTDYPDLVEVCRPNLDSLRLHAVVPLGVAVGLVGLGILVQVGDKKGADAA